MIYPTEAEVSADLAASVELGAWVGSEEPVASEGSAAEAVVAEEEAVAAMNSTTMKTMTKTLA